MSRVQYAAVPAYFTGDKSKFEDFTSQLRRYFGAYATEFDTSSKRIWFTLSLLRSEDGQRCPSAVWARNWERLYLTEDGEIKKWKTTNAQGAEVERDMMMSDFISQLEASFLDKTRKQTALLRLRKFRQGKKPLSDYLTDFEMLADEAGLNPGDHGEVLIDYLEENVNKELTDPLYNGVEVVPTAYYDYTAVLTKVAGNLEKKRIRGELWAPGFTFRTGNSNSAASSSSKAQGTGTSPNTQKSTPAPMDVDKTSTRAPIKCYNCNKEGHIARNCPEPAKPRKINLRNLTSQLDNEEKGSATLEALAAYLREKGF